MPGSSGGGVWTEDGKYMGMVVRGSGETFNLIVPIRRIRAWAKRVNVEFVFDPKIKAPTAEELKKTPVDDTKNFGKAKK